jgi:hypothetical protein
MNNAQFQNSIRHLLNVSIAIVTLMIAIGLISPTQWLINYQPDFEYSRMYFSVMLPVELLSILLPILVLIKDLNFNPIISKTAISILIFNLYSFFVLSNFYPLFMLDGSEYSSLYGLAYQVFLSLSNYITCLYGSYFVYTTISNGLNK